jgi:hypothetical protein
LLCEPSALEVESRQNLRIGDHDPTLLVIRKPTAAIADDRADTLAGLAGHQRPMRHPRYQLPPSLSASTDLGHGAKD